jgi:hypothetical protein
VDWLFRNRQTGEITIVQRPNAAAGIFVVAYIVKRVVNPSGGFDSTLTVIADGALAFWAADELLRGVNPFRRALGAVILVWLLTSLMF